MDNKYQSSRVYKIVDIEYTKCYVGSTYNSLSKRMAHHRQDYLKYKRGKKNYVSVFDLFDEFGVENCKIELIEEIECTNRDQLRKREGFHIQSTDCVNKNCAGRSKQESDRLYRQSHKQEKADYHKQYHESHKEEKSEYDREYRQHHKHRIAEYMKEYQAQNRESISQARSEKVECECGCQVSRRNLATHRKAQKHKDLMLNIDE